MRNKKIKLYLAEATITLIRDIGLCNQRVDCWFSILFYFHNFPKLTPHPVATRFGPEQYPSPQSSELRQYYGLGTQPGGESCPGLFSVWGGMLCSCLVY